MNVEKVHDWLWEIPRSYRGDMRGPARVYTDEKMLDSILGDVDRICQPRFLEGAHRQLDVALVVFYE